MIWTVIYHVFTSIRRWHHENYILLLLCLLPILVMLTSCDVNITNDIIITLLITNCQFDIRNPFLITVVLDLIHFLHCLALVQVCMNPVQCLQRYYAFGKLGCGLYSVTYSIFQNTRVWRKMLEQSGGIWSSCMPAFERTKGNGAGRKIWKKRLRHRPSGRLRMINGEHPSNLFKIFGCYSFMTSSVLSKLEILRSEWSYREQTDLHLIGMNIHHFNISQCSRQANFWMHPICASRNSPVSSWRHVKFCENLKR